MMGEGMGGGMMIGMGVVWILSKRRLSPTYSLPS